MPDRSRMSLEARELERVRDRARRAAKRAQQRKDYHDGETIKRRGNLVLTEWTTDEFGNLSRTLYWEEKQREEKQHETVSVQPSSSNSDASVTEPSNDEVCDSGIGFQLSLPGI